MVLIAIGQHRHAVHPPHSKELTPEEIRRLRRFFEEAGVTPDAADVADEGGIGADTALDMVVTVDHHQARLYTIEGTPETGRRLRPYDPYHFLHHLAHKEEQELSGQRDPEEPSYYSLIIEQLAPAHRIVVLGHGTGNSNAAAHLEQVLRAQRPDIYRRIIAIKTVDLSAITEPQVLALAESLLHSSTDVGG
jgi:hypothetical protein